MLKKVLRTRAKNFGGGKVTVTDTEDIEETDVPVYQKRHLKRVGKSIRFFILLYIISFFILLASVAFYLL